MIDKNSAEYMFGQIMAQLNQGEKRFQEFGNGLANVERALGLLPCADEEARIKLLEDWKSRVNGHSKSEADVRSRAAVTIRTGLVIAGTTTLLNFVFWLLFWVITKTPAVAAAAGS